MDKLDVSYTGDGGADTDVALSSAFYIHLFLRHQSCRNISMNFDKNQCHWSKLKLSIDELKSIRCSLIKMQSFAKCT